MSRVTTLLYLMLISCISFANHAPKLYQIDMIVFTHQQTSAQQSENISTPLLMPNVAQAITLQTTQSNAIVPYHLLPSSSSQLSREYGALNRKQDYQVLFHYTWLQPSNNQRAIVLPSISRNGWEIGGTLRVRQSNYYLLDTDLYFTAANNNKIAFLFSQKQRLKPGTIYYLDHPRAGMLIKVHQIT